MQPITNPARRQMLKSLAATAPLSLLGACALLPALNSEHKEMNPMNTTSHDENNSGIHDFDFLLGSWRIENRRLTKRLQNCHDWETFEAFQRNWPLPGGIGNFDDFIAESWRPGFVGMSLRLFNRETKLWSIYWLDNRNAGLNTAGVLMPPVVGKFANGVGIFETDDELDGKPVKVRYTWSGIQADRATWEQAMSADLGKTWETNWRMQMSKIG